MSQFSLPEDALQRIAAQVNLSGTFNHTVRSAWGSHQAMFRLSVDRGPVTTTAAVEMGGEKHSITLKSTCPQRHIDLADFIDAIANGRVDSAALAPARVSRLALMPEPEPLLDATQEAELQLLVRKGGAGDLHLGFKHPIKVAIHRTRGREGITAILSIGQSKPRTSCFTIYGRNAELFRRVLQSVEHLATAATPSATLAAA